jgi:hypothetical protein
MRAFLDGLATLGEAILVALAIPAVILAVGTPVVLLVRLVLEVARAL